MPMRATLIAAAALASVSLAGSQALGPTLRQYGAIEWKISGSLPPGAEYHLLYEDKATHAVQLLVRFPSGYSLSAHSHAHDETLVVLRGRLAVENGGRETVLGPGSYAVFPAGSSHALKAKAWGRCEFLVSMNGPFDIQGLPALKY